MSTTPKRKVAGGSDTTTATRNNVKFTLALYGRIKVIFIRFASWLAVMFRGIA